MNFAIWIVFIFIVTIVFLTYRRKVNTGDPEHIVQFVQGNSGNHNVSLSIQHNDQQWAEVNPNQPLPLASTVKIILAIEYARQAAEGKIDPDKTVKFSDLEPFYFPKTDGGAHEAWLHHLRKEEKEIDRVPLSEVANGMIAYSSNANTEYFMHILGLENINQLLDRLELFHHDPIYPVVSALYIPVQLMHEESLSEDEVLHVIKEMDMTEYRQRALDIHTNWLSQPFTDQDKDQFIRKLSMDFQRIWSDRLPRSTTKDYVSIMKKLNRKMYFWKKVHAFLDPVMEQLMQNPKNREWLKHAGQKGGSTAFIVAMSMYATDQEGNKTEIAFFANDLSAGEQTKLSRNMNAFLLTFLKDEAFRTSIKTKFE